MHRVDKHGVGLSGNDAVLVETIVRRSGDGGLADGNRLTLIVDVRMVSQELAVGGKLFENDQLILDGQLRRVERECHLRVAIARLGRELGRGRDNLAVGIDKRLAGLLIHQRAGKGVLVIRADVLIMHGVDDRDLGFARDRLVAVQAIDRRGGQLRALKTQQLLRIVPIGMLHHDLVAM